MATISTVAVDFIANTAKYIAGLTKVKNETNKFSNDAEKQFDKVSKSSKRMGSGLNTIGSQLNQLRNIVVGGAIAQFVAQVSQAAGEIADLSDELRISTQDLQRFQSLFEKSGNKLEDVRNIFTKLQKSAFDASEGNVSLQGSFAKLGINVDTFLKLSPEDRITAFARALQGIADPSEKAALAQEILGKNSGKTLAALQELAENNGIEGATKGIFVNSQEAIKAVDALGDSATNTLTSIKRFAIEAIGQLAIASKNLTDLQTKYKTTNLFAMQGGIGGAGASVAAAIAGAPTGLEVSDLAQAQREQSLIRQRNAQSREAARALEIQAEAIRKVRDSILAAVDPAAKYASEVDKINETVRKNKLSEEDRQKLIAGISQAYIFAVDPVKKYEAEIAKINADKGLSEKQKADNIRLLARQYEDIIDPANQYKKLVEDLNALQQKSVITDEEKRTVLNNLGSSYRSLYDPAEKYVKLQRELLSLPRGSNVDILKAIRATGKEFTNILNPLQEFDDKLKEVDAFTKAQFETERAVLRQIYDKYKAEGTLTQQRIDIINAEGEAIAKKYNAENEYIRNSIIIAKKATFEKEAGALANDRILIAEANRREELLRIGALVRASEQKGSNLVINESLKRQMVLQTEVNYFNTVNKEILQGFQYMSDFADQFSRALVEGQNFGEALSNVFKNILRDITVLILRTAILQTIMAAIGLASPVAATSFGQLTGIIPTPRAKGGPVMAGDAYRVGEAGPETFVPSTNGYILPNDMQSGETVNVYQTINVQTGVAQTVKAEMFSLLPRFKQEAMAGVLDAKQRGGSYSKLLTA